MGGDMKKKILIVDDDPDILEAVGMLLELEGFSVTTSTRGEDAEKLKGNYPDLILLDVLLSGKDGRTIAKHLKQQTNTRNIPIVMMSAHPSAHTTIKEYLADDFIPKPFELDHLVGTIKSHLPS